MHLTKKRSSENEIILFVSLIPLKSVINVSKFQINNKNEVCTV